LLVYITKEEAQLKAETLHHKIYISSTRQIN